MTNKQRKLETEKIKMSGTRLISVSAKCKQIDPALVLHSVLGQERFYWEDKRCGITYVGFGIAADLQAWGVDRFSSIKTQVQALFENAHIHPDTPTFAEPQLFGGFSFSADFTPDNTWSIYHPAQFILPHYQLAIFTDSDGSQSTWLTLNTLFENDDQLADEELDKAVEQIGTQLQDPLVAMQARLQALGAAADPMLHPPITNVEYPMDFETWETMLNAGIDQFHAGNLDKVVLSRVAEIRFSQNVNVDKALAYLGQQYPNCYRFLFEPRAYHAFFGASPEMLVSATGRELTTMGLAGSEPRGASTAEDDRLGQQLLDSPKDRHEHDLVVEAIRTRLSEISSELDIPATPSLLKLSNIQHLYTPIRATLNGTLTIFDLVELLHPTPALGGAPRADALKFISQHEPVPRGWYAAPVGLVNRRMDGAFSVAIRSAVTEYERVWLHAGAGIVAASDPQKEWDETALKFRPILNALGIT